MSFPAHFPVDTQGCISRDLPCIRCGYVLRTLTPGASCPECATPVIKSLDIDRIHFAPRAWRKSLVVNLYVLAAFPLAWFLLNATCLAGIALLASTKRDPIVAVDLLLGANVGMLLAYVVVLSLTMRLRPDIRNSFGRHPVDRRGNWAMACTGIGSLGLIAIMVALMVPVLSADGEEGWTYVLLVGQGFLAIGFGLAMSRLASYARTIPRRRLAGNVALVGWTLAGTAFLSIISSLLMQANFGKSFNLQQLSGPSASLSIPVTTAIKHPTELGWSPPVPSGAPLPAQPQIAPQETNRTVTNRRGIVQTNIAYDDGSSYVHALLPDRSWNASLQLPSGDVYRFYARAPVSGQNQTEVTVFHSQNQPPATVQNLSPRLTTLLLTIGFVSQFLSCILLVTIPAAMIALFMLARAVSAIR